MMDLSKKIALALVASVAVLSTGPVAASDWMFRIGAHQVDPKSRNHSVVNVDAAPSLTLSAVRFLGDNWALEVLAAVPFEHDINLNATGAEVASTRHLPPTVTLQYHFSPGAARFRPYVGAGLNYTIFFDEKTKGALAGSRLALDDSVGVAAELGADFVINERWSVNAHLRWFDIDTDAKLDSTKLGSVQIDPLAVGFMLTRRFSLSN